MLDHSREDSRPRIAAIVICFHPDVDKLGLLVARLGDRVDEIILFDNGGLDVQHLPTSSTRLRVEARGGQNLGVASALNIACEVAWQDGCRYAVSFDQDSLPRADMVPTLLAELRKWSDSGRRVAAIGPQLEDVRDGTVRARRFVRASSIRPGPEGEETQPVALLITSGCLFDLAIWRDIARFDDRLFIDYVDHNWCWRLARSGYIVLGTTKTSMQHELSAGLKDTRWITFTKYGPVRRYFQCRNAVYHLLYVATPRGGKWFLLRNLGSTILAAAFSDDAPARSLWQCLRGCGHGLFGRLGPFRP